MLRNFFHTTSDRKVWENVSILPLIENVGKVAVILHMLTCMHTYLCLHTYMHKHIHTLENSSIHAYMLTLNACIRTRCHYSFLLDKWHFAQATHTMTTKTQLRMYPLAVKFLQYLQIHHYSV